VSGWKAIEHSQPPRQLTTAELTSAYPHHIGTCYSAPVVRCAVSHYIAGLVPKDFAPTADGASPKSGIGNRSPPRSAD
jgi:hypothetical protein